MKEISVVFEASDRSLKSVLPPDRLEAAAKLLKSLCESADFRQRLADFLNSSDWEVPTVSWLPPHDI